MKPYNFRLILLTVLLCAICPGGLVSQEAESTVPAERGKNSIEIFPVFEINMLQYGRRLSPRDELVFGILYYNPSVMNAFKYPGTQQVFAVEAGYRRYLWKGLNLEWQLYPTYSICEDRTTDTVIAGFGLATELRLGYKWKFELFELPLYINMQFFATYHLLNSRPQNFVDRDIEAGTYPLALSPIPMIFLGMDF